MPGPETLETAGFTCQFGAFELDGLRLQLRRGGVPLDVEPKPLEVLVELVRNAGELVTKQELMESVWGGRPVTDYVLTRCINKLRSALDDSLQSLIQSVYGQGYRFTAPVLRVPATPLSSAMDYGLSEGGAVPARPQWRLVRALDAVAGVWLAERVQTSERRVFKFALRPERISSLKRELTVHRMLRAGLGDSGDFVRLLDYNIETPPYFLELDWSEHGSLINWLQDQGGPSAVPLEQRLGLLAQAAESLAKAHALGVLHLDVKPANLLVAMTASGQPGVRWSDFGSGRLLSPERLQEMGITRIGDRTQAASDSGTLMYLAPEVIAGHPPTALADVYALGVMLYQLACGQLTKPLAPGWERDVDDDLLREDIAAAVAGEPERRLGSASEFAQRLRNLALRRAERRRQQQVASESLAMARRVERMRARRPWLVGASLALVMGLISSLYLYREARLARDSARNEAAIATGVEQFFNRDVMGSVSRFDPAVRRNVTVREAMDRALAGLDANGAPPLVEAQIRYSISYTLIQLSDFNAAVRQSRRSAELFSATLGPYDSRTLLAESSEAESLLFDSKFTALSAFLDRFDAKIAGRSGLDPELYLGSESMRGAGYFQSGQYSLALPLYHAALADHERLHPADTSGRVTRHVMLALTYAHLGRFVEAHAEVNEALADAGRVNVADRETTLALAREPAGVIFTLQGRYAEAEPLLQAAHEVLAKSLGEDESETAESESYLGLVYLATGRFGLAEQATRAAYLAYQSRYGNDNVDTLVARVRLGMAECAVAKRPQAISDLSTAHQGLEKIVNSHAPDAQFAAYQLAHCAAASNPAAARPLLAGLDPATLRQAAPAANWEVELADLRKQLQP